MNNAYNLSAGKLLVSEPFMSSAYFRRSVVLLVEHDDEGSFGVVLNKPTPYPLKNKVLRPDIESLYLNKGGPVDVDLIFFIHALGEHIEGSYAISNELYWGGNYEQVIHLLNNHVLHKDNIWFFLGYAGWSAGQLEQEMKSGAWVVWETPLLKLMHSNGRKMWENAVTTMGNPYSSWVNFPLNPMQN